MLRWAVSACVALVIALNVPAKAHAQNVDGTWKLSYFHAGTESMVAIITIKSQDAKISGELVATSPIITNLSLKSVTQNGGILRIALTTGKIDRAFDAIIPSGKPSKITGTFSSNAPLQLPGTLQALFPGSLTLTDETKLTKDNETRSIECPPAKEARILNSRVTSLRGEALQTKDAEKKKALLKEAADANRIASRRVPALYKEVIGRFSDSTDVFDATIGLVRFAKVNNAKTDDVAAWADAGTKLAKSYGPRYEAEFTVLVSGFLLNQDVHAKLALAYAKQAEKALTADSRPAFQIRVLKNVVRALKANDQMDEMKSYDLRLAKLDAQLEAEYVKTMPPFTGTAFTGRKSKSDKTVFMELFTGATCPPCVAADLAFDVLQKSYKPSDLVLLQYHVHIPGPDPMTNPDTLARWSYYTKAFSKEVRGVPSSIFNGKPATKPAQAGGGLVDAELKYQSYRNVINPLLEIDAGAKLTAHAVRKGDRIDINVSVDKLDAPGADKKLRILLAEETVRYAGSNKIRFHHNVVRAFPGGVEGKALTEAASKHTASINIGELRGSLNKYLTEFEANGRSFQNPARPLEMANLRVIAFVQDDTTHEILQTVQVEVEAK